MFEIYCVRKEKQRISIHVSILASDIYGEKKHPMHKISCSYMLSILIYSCGENLKTLGITEPRIAGCSQILSRHCFRNKHLTSDL